MTAEEHVLMLVRGAIASQPPEVQQQIQAAAAQLRTVIKAAGDAGIAAMALVGAELDAGIQP